MRDRKREKEGHIFRHILGAVFYLLRGVWTVWNRYRYPTTSLNQSDSASKLHGYRTGISCDDSHNVAHQAFVIILI